MNIGIYSIALPHIQMPVVRNISNYNSMDYREFPHFSLGPNGEGTTERAYV